MALHIFRVVVRGEFSDLTDDRRAALLADAPAHDIMQSSYTKAGTFTYDERLVAFSYRFEVRQSTEDGSVDPDAIDAAVRAAAEAAAEADLTERGLMWKRLRSNAVDMADMWRDAHEERSTDRTHG